jgi:hypothetical protein
MLSPYLPGANPWLGDEPAPARLRRPTACLTPRGTVAASIVRLEYDLAELAGEDRAYCLDLVRDLLEGAGA